MVGGLSMVTPTVVEGTCKSVLFVIIEGKARGCGSSSGGRRRQVMRVGCHDGFFVFATHGTHPPPKKWTEKEK